MLTCVKRLSDQMAEQYSIILSNQLLYSLVNAEYPMLCKYLNFLMTDPSSLPIYNRTA